MFLLNLFDFRMLNFNLFSIIYKNLYTLITSNDLSKVYCVGFILGFFFCFQILSGVLLSFIYNNNFNNCWFSVINMIDFEAGFLIRSIHITGTSFIYFNLYLHIFKTFLYTILHNTSFLIWLIGFIIYFLSVIIAFIGYVLPLTQMSYWGLTVFSNILSTLPFIGKILCYWVWGSEFIQDFTLIKVHSLHIFLPFILLFFIVFHFFFLHYFLSSDTFDDRFCFYYEKNIFIYFFLFRDLFVSLFYFYFFTYFLYINWYFVFHEESFEIVNTMKTSDKIIPEWFFLTFFGFIKAIPDKFGGICVLVVFLICFFFLNFFIVFLNKYYYISIYYFSNVILLFYLLYFIGILSTNVTLLFPFIEILQIFVFFLIFLFSIKFF